MKIDTTIKNVTAPRGKDAKSGKTQTAVLTPAGVAVSDDVRLTDTSAKMRGLEAELARIDVADGGKIESVRQAIADGSFVVDEEAVAESLIQESIDNITHHPQR